MSKSLQDQLLSAGLTDKKKAKAIKKDKKKQKNLAKRDPSVEQDDTKQRLQAERIAKAEKDRELNRKRNEEAQQRAVAAQIKQLILTNAIKRDSGETAYNFKHGAKVKSLYLSDQLIDLLARGQIAMAVSQDQYFLIPSKVAQKILERDGSAILVLNERKKGANSAPEEDEYAEFQIPDDLMW